jgi:hypothetical protein
MKVREMRLGGSHRIAGAALFALPGKHYSRFSAGVSDLCCLMADHDHKPVGVQALCGMENMREQGFPCNTMEHFGPG